MTDILFTLATIQPLIDPIQPPGTEKVYTVISWAMWLVSALAIVAIFIVAAVMMFQNRRGEGGEHAARLGWVLFGCILISAASAITAALL